jgi:UDP-N-acetyl-alpha-D-muramoyl-L-alanyl-L-glutamate epimerase
VLFGHDIAVRKAGGDLFADPGLSGLYAAMAGLPGAGDKPFECTGTEEEVRSAIQAAGQHGTDLPALGTCLRDAAVKATRPLDVVLKDWGQDDLLPAALKARVRRAAHR